MKSVNTSLSSMTMNSRGQHIISHSENNFCKVIDAQSLKLSAPDGIYGSRKTVSAIDDKLYTFDKIFPDDSTQEDIYQHVAQHVEATVRGYNTTIFAYGATGSGKSHTMTGDKHAPGIIPRAIGDLFRHSERSAATESDVFFYVRLSYVELYNNSFRNLLEHVSKERTANRTLSGTGSSAGSINLSMSGFFSELDDVDPDALQYEALHGTSFAAARATSSFAVPKHAGFAHRTDKIEVRDSQQGAGVFLAGPNLRFPVTSAMEAYQLIARGNKYRHVGVTQCNDVSSRSHAILTLHVESRVCSTPAADGKSSSELRLGKMHLVDLAGSERLALSKAEGETLHETQNINLSLSHLGDVLNALSKNAMIELKQQKMLTNGDANYKKMPAFAPVPYRNSKLTHLLKDSLGGNSKTIMITNIRTTDEYFQQTQISLDYATRAKKVRNRSLVNRDIIAGDTGIHTVNTEIERLKKSLEDRQSEFDRMQQLQQHDAKENNALKSRLQEMNAANDSERRQLEKQVSQVIHSQAGHIASQREKISLLQHKLQEELTVSQNRIAEQEKEIRWLKKALEETSQAAEGLEGNKEKERLMQQRVIEAWQAQAKTVHQELSTVVRQAEELQEMNTFLNAKLGELEGQKKILEEEARNSRAEATDVTSVMHNLLKEKDTLQELNDSMQRAYQDAKRLMQDQVDLVQQKNDALYQYEQQLQDLDEELQRVQEGANDTQNKALKSSSHLTERIRDLERDKSELTERLNSTLASLEKRTAMIISEANEKVKRVEEELALAVANTDAVKSEKEKLLIQQKQLEANLIKKLSEKDERIDSLRDELQLEQDTVKKQQLKMLNMEGMVEEFKEKMNKLKDKQRSLEEEKAEALRLRAESEHEWMNKLDAALEDHEDQVARIEDAHEKDKSLAIQGRTAELQRALQEAIAEKEQELLLTEERHQSDLQQLQKELLDQEGDFRRRVQETEKRMQLMIEEEVSQSIRRLEEQHQAEVRKIQEANAQENTRLLREQQQQLLKEKDATIAELRRNAEQQKLQALEEVERKHNSAAELLRKKSASQLKALTDEAREEREKQQQEHSRKLDSMSKTHLLTQGEVEEKTRQETQERFERKLRDLAERHRLDLAEQLENERAKLLAEFSREIASLGNALSQADAYADEQQSEQQKLRENAEQARRSLLGEHQQQLDELQSRLSKQFTRELKEREAQLEAKHANAIELERKLLAVQYTADAQKQIHGAVEEALVQQEQELNQTYRREVLTLKDQFAREQADLEDSIRDEFNREKEKLFAQHKKEVHELRQSMEDTHRSTADEKGKLIADLKEQLALQAEQHREELSGALSQQQEDMLDRHRKESLKLRNELQEAEARHQSELNEALQKHVQEISSHRKQLEGSHSKLVESLQEELAAVKERCNEALALAAAKDGESTAALLLSRTQFEDQLKKSLDDKERQFSIDKEAIEEAHKSEVARLKALLDKMKARHDNDIKAMEEELLDEKQRALSLLKDRHVKELAEAKSQQAQDLESQLQDAQSRYKQELVRLREDVAQQEAEKGELMSDAERRVKELSDALREQRRDFEVESQKIKEEQRVQQEIIQRRHSEDASKLEMLQQELERSMKTKHKQQLRLIKDEAAAEMERQNEEMRAELQRREEAYQQEIEQLKDDAQQQLYSLQTDIEEANRSLQEAQKKLSGQSELIKQLEDELDEERQSHGQSSTALSLRYNALEEQYAKLQDTAALSEAAFKRQVDEAEAQRQAIDKLNEEKIVALKEQQQRDLEEVTRNHGRQQDDLKEQLSLQIQQNQRLRATLDAEHDAAVKDTQERYESKLHALEEDLQSERAHNEALKNKYERLLTQSRDVFEEEKESIKHTQSAAARREIQQKEAALEAMKAEHETAVVALQKYAEQAAQKLQGRISELTAELEQREKLLEESKETLLRELEEEKQAASEEAAAHFRELQSLRASLEEQNRTELKQLEEELQQQHQEELDRALQEQHGTAVMLQQRALEATKQELQKDLDQALNDLRAAEVAKSSSRQQLEQLKDDLETANSRIRRLKEGSEELQTQHLKALTEREDQLRRLFAEEKELMQAQLNKSLQQTAESVRSESEQVAAALKAAHEKECDQLTRRNAEALDALADEKAKETKALQRQLDNLEDEEHNLQRQVVKADAQKEAAAHELDVLKAERQQMRDKIHALEMELIEHGKQKFDARLQAEKHRLEQEYAAAFGEVKREVALKMDDHKALELQLAQRERELAAAQAASRSSEDERERMEHMFRSLLAEKEAQHEQQLKAALEAQQDELQGGYLKLIQQQVEQLMGLIQSQSTQPALSHMEELHEKFLSLVQDLPDVWREKHGIFPGEHQTQQQQKQLMAMSTPTTRIAAGSSSRGSPDNHHQGQQQQQQQRDLMLTPKTPLSLLARESDGDYRDDPRAVEGAVRRSKFGPTATAATAAASSSTAVQQHKSRPNNLPWSSPSLRSSPMDQLIAAILDGDVQGIRAVVRSKGENLQCDYWRDLSKTILPLHRAVSGLHFHGSEKLLVSTIDTLAQLRADVNAADHAGNSVLHKAIQVCTSKSAAAVVNTLLRRGSDPTARNKDGDTPLHSECKRVRSASVEVIDALAAAGADVNARNPQNGAVTPLTLVLLRGAASTSTGIGLLSAADHNGNSNSSDGNIGYGLEISPSGRTLTLGGGIGTTDSNDAIASTTATTSAAVAAAMDPERSRIASRRVWLRAADALCKQGAQWDPHWSTPRGCSQLHLLLSAFPPARDESSIFRKLLKSALDSGHDPAAAETDRGRSALFVLCEQLSAVSSEQCPDSTRLIHMLLDAVGSSGSSSRHHVIHTADRTGRTVLDIADSKVDNSCYAACRPILRDASYDRSTRSRNGSSSSNGYDVDERPRASSAIVAAALNAPVGSFAVPGMSARRSQQQQQQQQQHYQHQYAGDSSRGGNGGRLRDSYHSSPSPAVPMLSQGAGGGNSSSSRYRSSDL